MNMDIGATVVKSSLFESRFEFDKTKNEAKPSHGKSGICFHSRITAFFLGLFRKSPIKLQMKMNGSTTAIYVNRGSLTNWLTRHNAKDLDKIDTWKQIDWEDAIQQVLKNIPKQAERTQSDEEKSPPSTPIGNPDINGKHSGSGANPPLDSPGLEPRIEDKPILGTHNDNLQTAGTPPSTEKEKQIGTLPQTKEGLVKFAEALQEKAKAEDPEAAFTLALLYKYGAGVPDREQDSTQLLQLAVDKGLPKAIAYVGAHGSDYKYMSKNLSEDQIKGAIASVEEASKQGDKEAEFVLTMAQKRISFSQIGMIAKFKSSWKDLKKLLTTIAWQDSTAR